MKEEIAGRPLLGASLALAAGISSLLHPLNLLALPLLLFLCWGRLQALIFVCLGFLLGVILAPGNFVFSGQTGLWSKIGVVSTVPTLLPHGETFLLQTDGEAVLVNAGGRSDIVYGQTLQVTGTLSLLRDPRVAGLALGGISGQVAVAPGKLHVIGQAPLWFDLSNGWRRSFLASTDAALDVHQAAMVNAVCFASSGSLSKESREDLSRVGVAHVLSVSGLQILLVAFLVQFLLSQLPIPRGVQILAVAVVLALYATASGLHPATIRAALMAVLALSAYLVRREPDLLSALGLAAIVTLLWQPWSVFTPGFQFSYVVVAALSLYWQRIRYSREAPVWQRVRRRALQVVSMSFVATLAVAPLTAYHFGVVSLISSVSNLLVSPILPVVVLVSMISWPIGLIAPPVQVGLMRLIVGPCASWMMLVTGWFGGQSWAAITWPPFNPYWMVLYYGAFLLLWTKKWRPRRDSNA